MSRFAVRGVWLVAVFGLALALPLGAQTKAKKAPKPSNVQGSVVTMDKAKSTITVKVGSTRRDVMYSADTKFMHGHSNKNTPGSADQIKENNYISCSGTFEAGKVQLMAQQCIYRETK